MKKHIECHYKDGSLIFCTSQSFCRETACQILHIFNKLGLVSTIHQQSDDLYQIVGRLQVNYDPFKNKGSNWNSVISEVSRTKEVLEKDLQSYW